MGARRSFARGMVHRETHRIYLVCGARKYAGYFPGMRRIYAIPRQLVPLRGCSAVPHSHLSYLPPYLGLAQLPLFCNLSSDIYHMHEIRARQRERTPIDRADRLFSSLV